MARTLQFVMGDEHHTLLVWNLRDNSLMEFEDTQGPAAFTPDGSTLVGHGYVEGSDEQRTLRIIDPASRSVHVERIPNIGSPSYFVTPDGNRIVVASTMWENNDDIVLTTWTSGVRLRARPTRTGEAANRANYAFRLRDSISISVPGMRWSWMTWRSPRRISAIGRGLARNADGSSRTLLVVDDTESARLFFVAPDESRVVSHVQLPAAGDE